MLTFDFTVMWSEIIIIIILANLRYSKLFYEMQRSELRDQMFRSFVAFVSYFSSERAVAVSARYDFIFKAK